MERMESMEPISAYYTTAYPEIQPDSGYGSREPTDSQAKTPPPPTYDEDFMHKTCAMCQKSPSTSACMEKPACIRGHRRGADLKMSPGNCNNHQPLSCDGLPSFVIEKKKQKQQKKKNHRTSTDNSGSSEVRTLQHRAQHVASEEEDGQILRPDQSLAPGVQEHCCTCGKSSIKSDTLH